MFLNSNFQILENIIFENLITFMYEQFSNLNIFKTWILFKFEQFTCLNNFLFEQYF
jgi:hypothetical protein